LREKSAIKKTHDFFRSGVAIPSKPEKPDENEPHYEGKAKLSSLCVSTCNDGGGSPIG